MLSIVDEHIIEYSEDVKRCLGRAVLIIRMQECKKNINER